MAQTDGLCYLGPHPNLPRQARTSDPTLTGRTTPELTKQSEEYRDMATEETEQRTTTEEQEDNRSLFVRFAEEYAEEELAIILIAAGVVMMVIPPFQPVGIASIFLGLAVWFSDWLWG